MSTSECDKVDNQRKGGLKKQNSQMLARALHRESGQLSYPLNGSHDMTAIHMLRDHGNICAENALISFRK